MTSEEALEVITTLVEEYSPVKLIRHSKDYKMLNVLVERDTPMIPIYKSIELICPKCRERQHTNTARFCSECGQKLLW